MKLTTEFKNKADRYLSGNMSENEVDQFWAELIEDGEKLNYVKNMKHLRHLAATDDPVFGTKSNTPNIVPLWRRPVTYAAAAAIALLFTILALFQLDAPPQDLPQAMSTVALDINRTGTDADQEALRTAYDLFNSGKPDQAITILQSELDEAQNSKVRLELAKMYYNLDKFSKAETHFSSILNSEAPFVIQDEAIWLLAHVYMKQGEWQRAEKQLNKAIAHDGAYSRAAKTYLRKLNP